MPLLLALVLALGTLPAQAAALRQSMRRAISIQSIFFIGSFLHFQLISVSPLLLS